MPIWPESSKKTRSVLTIVAALSALSAASNPVLADYQLTILHINDVHARFEPINKYNSSCSEEDNAAGECFGGLARLKAGIDQRREALAGEGKNVLTLDAGDQFQGSLFYTMYKGQLAAELMNTVGIDAMAVGNHEFDLTPDALTGGLQASFSPGEGFPLISSNIAVQLVVEKPVGSWSSIVK